MQNIDPSIILVYAPTSKSAVSEYEFTAGSEIGSL